MRMGRTAKLIQLCLCLWPPEFPAAHFLSFTQNAMISLNASWNCLYSSEEPSSTGALVRAAVVIPSGLPFIVFCEVPEVVQKEVTGPFIQDGKSRGCLVSLENVLVF